MATVTTDVQSFLSSADSVKPALPTLDKLGVSLQPDLDVQKVAAEWFRAFSQHISSSNVPGIVGLLLEDGWWRDQLVLTWEFRTFHGADKVQKFLEDRLPVVKPASFKLGTVSLTQPYPDLAWIVGFFDFETEVGVASGVFRLVPTSSGVWKAFTVYTNLEDLKGFPEKIGPNRDFQPNHGKWVTQREQEKAFVDRDPAVLIIGGGQSGLDVAARLKHLGISNLIVESQPRVGNQWRYRYEALCLHDPVWYDHMPYMPFPPSWPVYTPAQKLAGWLEYYAEAMELNIWLSTTATRIEQLEGGKWTVAVQREDGSERVFHVDHVVMALGFGGGLPKMPTVPGQEEFQGQILHSTEHGSARDHIGKKVVIVGAATSAHDIAGDYAEHGVDVTLFQRSSTYIMTTKEGMPRVFRDYWEGAAPTDIADRLSNSLPIKLQKEIAKRSTIAIARADKELLEGLHKVGFKYHFGVDDSGFLHMAFTRGGGYYLDVGTCQKIVDGKVKLKNDSQIERFTKTGLKFTNGSELEADVVLFATGFEGADTAIKKLVSPEVGSKLGPIWDLTPEGEERGAWRWLGVPNLWFMMGNLAMCRFHSKHLALQIKAIQEGIYGQRYAP
ncbi:uncharacterized protein FIBRA_02002 [Fibroporia radiculosa]|uniref:FAD/NAD(P)-binding domain-containing protein n=1 Tax=Fibroporia radiculosa TaxID=599839 RepID=J4HU80_9APHY|nr:uncharacterized protein FIBRA_02002 [Fibroporia radiculosa]CCL99977.1 predicted protein [Fibroporia radiculosa]